MGFMDVIPAVSRTIAVGRLYPSGGGSQHGGVLALAFAPLWAGDVLERCSLARPRAEPNVCRSLTRGRRTQKAWTSAREPEEGQQGCNLVQRRLCQRAQLHARAPTDVRRTVRTKCRT